MDDDDDDYGDDNVDDGNGGYQSEYVSLQVGAPCPRTQWRFCVVGSVVRGSWYSQLLFPTYVSDTTKISDRNENLS